MTRFTRPAVVVLLALLAVRVAAAPPGMAWVPGGVFRMGSDSAHFADATPVHPVWVGGLWVDVTEVTNAQFAAFVKATGYVTVAEKKPKAEDFPGAPAEALVAGSACHDLPKTPVPLDNALAWWKYVPGADWRHPEGPASDLGGRDAMPVVHVAYADAEAYAAWAGKRLPTEAEWEHFARGGLDGKSYPWGDDFRPAGRIMANTFQGHFPDHDTAEDGYRGAAPVKSFPPNGYGLYDTSGNVWEWTSDWYHPRTYAAYAVRGLSVNPQGPAEADAVDPDEPGVKKRVQKGGSFLCTDQYCARYMPGGRGKGEPSTGASHVGFRCVKAAE